MLFRRGHASLYIGTDFHYYHGIACTTAGMAKEAHTVILVGEKAVGGGARHERARLNGVDLQQF